MIRALKNGEITLQPHEYWQTLLPADTEIQAPYADAFPARLPDGQILALPIRALTGTDTGIASLILNQASFAVEAALAGALVDRLAVSDVDVIVGLPTLGLSLARAVAEGLGHARYVPLGTSRKFWYDDLLSVPLRSITSIGGDKRLYVDPRMLPLIQGRRVCLVDDVISSGTSICAARDLLAQLGVTPVVIATAMLQTCRWKARLNGTQPVAALHTPLLVGAPGCWTIKPDDADV